MSSGPTTTPAIPKKGSPIMSPKREVSGCNAPIRFCMNGRRRLSTTLDSMRPTISMQIAAIIFP